MMELTYAGKDVLVSDEAGEALTEYARMLASTGGSDTVVLPVIADGGELTEAFILIGPASQLVVTRTHGHTDLHDGDVVAMMQQRALELGTSKPQPDDLRDDFSFDFEL